MTNYIIRFAPELDVDGVEFVHAWNQHQPAASLAQATLPDERSRDAGMMSEIVILLGIIATGVATNALYDMIKEYAARLAKKPKVSAAPVVYKDIEIHETQQPDGTKVLQVVMKPTKK